MKEEKRLDLESDTENQDEIICYCSGVYKSTIVDAVKNGAETLSQIRQMTGACTVGKCIELSPLKKCCSSNISQILEECLKNK